MFLVWFWPSPPAALAQTRDPFRLINLTSMTQSRYSSFQLPQIHATVQMPSPSYILPPYHPTLTQSLSFPFLSLPCHALAATHLCLQNYLYRERKNDVFMYFPAATHHFPQNFLCRERGNAVFRHIHAATHLFPKNTLYRERKQPHLLQTKPPQTRHSEQRHTI